MHIQCTHCSSHYIFCAHCSHVQPCTAICSQPSVHTAANCSHLQPSTLQLYYPVHTAAILFSAHCSHVQPCTAICSQPSVHPAANCSHLHCSYTNQCTLQLYYSVHTVAMYSYLQPTFSAHCSQLQPSTTIYTAAILSSAHCSYTIQCTLQPCTAMYSYLQPTFSAPCSQLQPSTLQLY